MCKNGLLSQKGQAMRVFTTLFFAAALIGKTFSLEMTQNVIFDTQDSLQIPQNTPFSASVTISVSGNTVSVAIPSLTFSLPVDHSPIVPPQVPGYDAIGPFSIQAGGYVYTRSGFVPQQYRPAAGAGVSTPVNSTSPSPGLIALVSQEGNIRFAANASYTNGPAYYPLYTSGSITTDAVTVSYPLITTSFTPPTNFVFSEGSTQEVYVQSGAVINQYLDSYFSDIYNDVIAAFWADNSATTSYPYLASGYVQTGTVTYSESGAQTVTLNTPVAVFTSPLIPSGYTCTQGGVAINPTDSRNMVANTLLLSPADGTPFGELWTAASTNGGTTWSHIQRIDTVSMYPNVAGDNNALFDSFGNYWVTNVTGNGTNRYLTILVSTDKGVTFSVAATVDPTASPYNGAVGSFFDFDQMAFGGDGADGFALYFVTDFINDSLTPCVGYIPVTGLGAYGTMTLVEYGSAAGYLGTHTVTSGGDIYINYCGNPQTASIPYLLYEITGGTTSVMAGTMLSSPNFWAECNLGLGYEAGPGLGTAYSGANAKAIRGQLPFSPVRGLAYDNTKGALYGIVYTTDPLYSQNCKLYLLVSTNGGSTWSNPYYIRNNPLGNCFEASIKLDPVSGDLLITWYDSSNDQPQNQYVQFFGTVISSAQLTTIINSL